MLMLPQSLLPALLALMLSLAPALSQVTPQEVLWQLFRENQTGNGGPVFAYRQPPTAQMQRLFSSDFVSTWARATAKDRGFPVIEGNPMTGSQSDQPQQLLSMAVDPAEDPYAVIRATIRDAGATATYQVRYTFLWQEGAWKIDEIEYVDLQVPPGALRNDKLKASLKALP